MLTILQLTKVTAKSKNEAKITTEKVESKAIKETAKVKKDATVTKEKAEKENAKVAKEVAKKVLNTKTETIKTAEKASENYNGKKPISRTRGGRYYIEANGNKTYVTSKE